MTLRPRRNPASPGDSGEFHDPLSNYDLPAYSDQMERELVENTINAMVTRPLITVPPTATVTDVLATMVERDVACVLVTDEQDHLLGIFSERDVLLKVAEHFEMVRDQPISEVMTPKPMAVYETASPSQALNLMAMSGFRHIPILDVDDRVVGIVGPRRVTRYLQGLIDHIDAQ
jgi:CBS domain-containing protein